MFTFTESFYNTSFYFQSGVPALKEYILDILNTDRGTRPYYPDYGLLLEKFKYKLLDLPTAQKIHAEVYFVINSIDNLRILNTNYRLIQKEKKLELYYDLIYGQEPIGLHLTYTEGGFK